MSLRDGSDRLARLDERCSRSGPLALVREVPQLGLLVVVSVFFAGVVVARNSDEAEDARQRGGVAAALALGPPVGSRIDDHFRTARERAVAVARGDPEGRYLALVSLSDERTPVEAQRLVAENGLTARRVYLRAPVGGELAEVLPVQMSGDLVAALTGAYEQTASRKAEEQRQLVSLAQSIESAGDADFKMFYEDAARAADQEVAAYRSACACVFALVVDARAAELAALASVPGVRGVELAPRGAELAALDITPLVPEATGVVEPPPPVMGGS